MEKIRNLSLKATIILYMAVALGISTAFSFGLTNYAKHTQENIWYKYVDKEEYAESVEKENGSNYLASIPRIRSRLMSDKDVFIVEACDVIETWGDLFISFLFCIIAVSLFYQKKLKRPLRVLMEASNRISSNDLSFEISYANQDEMGQLCKEFEEMRGELVRNKKKLWSLVEDERTLRSAIAHDIRTPIALIKGNLEIIDEFYPLHRLSEEHAGEMIGKTIRYVDHLEHFVGMMKSLNRLVDMTPQYKELSYQEVLGIVYEILKDLCKKNEKIFEFQHDTADCILKIDPVFLMEVEENLLNNAIQYATKKITGTLTMQEDRMVLAIEDDGPGFQKPPQKLLQAYSKRKEENGSVHYGLGLFISKSLCAAHGGELRLENLKTGGARAEAVFGIKT